MKYRLTKLQVKRLIDGKSVQTGSGIKIYASESLKEGLKNLDKNNVYPVCDIFLDTSTKEITIADKKKS